MDLTKTLEVLRDLRKELHDKVESSVLGQIDDVIFNLEQSNEDDASRRSAQEMLEILGLVMQYLPLIVKAIGVINDSTK
jgi:hypothetical protein